MCVISRWQKTLSMQEFYSVCSFYALVSPVFQNIYIPWSFLLAYGAMFMKKFNHSNFNGNPCVPIIVLPVSVHWMLCVCVAWGVLLFAVSNGVHIYFTWTMTLNFCNKTNINTGIIFKNGSWPFMYILSILYENGLSRRGLLPIYVDSYRYVILLLSWRMKLGRNNSIAWCN
jgi:hypothetical protein